MKRYEEAQNYIDNGMTTYEEILADVKDIATDEELRASMIGQAGSLEEYAGEIYEAVLDIINEE